LKKHTISDSCVGCPKTKESLIDLVCSGDIAPDWLSLNTKIKIDQNNKQTHVSAQIRVKKDSIIWFSLKAPLGIEILRTVITLDSVYFMNRLDKTYFVKSISHLKEVVKADISFFQFQEILFSSPNLKDKNLELLDNENCALSSAKANYNIHPLFFRVEELELIESEDKKLKINFYNYQLFNEISSFFPNTIKIDIESKEVFSAEIEYTKIVFNKKSSLSFKIPSSYVKMD
jgi:hypothetical protein